MKQIITVFCLIMIIGGSSNQAKPVKEAPKKENALQALHQLHTSIDSLSRSTDHLLKVVQ